MVFCRLPFPGVGAFLGFPGRFAPLLASFVSLWMLLRIRGFCVLEFCEFSTATACVLSHVFFFCLLSSSQDKMHCALSLTVCTGAPCQRASFNSTTDSFSWVHDPYTLACKARPSFDRCGTSLSVPLYCHCLGVSEYLRDSSISRLRSVSVGFPCALSRASREKSETWRLRAIRGIGRTIFLVGFWCMAIPPAARFSYVCRGQLDAGSFAIRLIHHRSQFQRHDCFCQRAKCRRLARCDLSSLRLNPQHPRKSANPASRFSAST